MTSLSMNQRIKNAITGKSKTAGGLNVSDIKDVLRANGVTPKSTRGELIRQLRSLSGGRTRAPVKRGASSKRGASPGRKPKPKPKPRRASGGIKTPSLKRTPLIKKVKTKKHGTSQRLSASAYYMEHGDRALGTCCDVRLGEYKKLIETKGGTKRWGGKCTVPPAKECLDPFFS